MKLINYNINFKRKTDGSKKKKNNQNDDYYWIKMIIIGKIKKNEKNEIIINLKIMI